MHRIKIIGSRIPQPVHRNEEDAEAQGSSEERWRNAWVRYQQDEARAMNLRAIRAMFEGMRPRESVLDDLHQSLKRLDAERRRTT